MQLSACLPYELDEDLTRTYTHQSIQVNACLPVRVYEIKEAIE